jgi:hypothetical protein
VRALRELSSQLRRFMLDAAPHGYLQKYNYKLLNTNGKDYRGLSAEEKHGPFTFTHYEGKFRGSGGKLITKLHGSSHGRRLLRQQHSQHLPLD